MIDWPHPIQARLTGLGQDPLDYRRYLARGEVSAEVAEARRRDELGWTGQDWDTPPVATQALALHETETAISAQEREVALAEKLLEIAVADEESTAEKYDQLPRLQKWFGGATPRQDRDSAHDYADQRRESVAARGRLDELTVAHSELPQMSQDEREFALYLGYRHGSSPTQVTETGETMRTALRAEVDAAEPAEYLAGEGPPWRTSEREAYMAAIDADLEVVPEPVLAEQRTRELTEIFEERRVALELAPILEKAENLKQDYFHLQTLENTPLGYYQEGQSWDEYADIDSSVMDRSEQRLVDFVTAHPEIHHVGQWSDWVREPEAGQPAAAVEAGEPSGRERPGPYEALVAGTEVGEGAELEYEDQGYEPF